jgi:hypothetical protein
MTTFLAVYRGESIASAKLVAVSADPDIVSDVATRLLKCITPDDGADEDPVLATIEHGRRQALRLIARDERRALAAAGEVTP